MLPSPLKRKTLMLALLSVCVSGCTLNSHSGSDSFSSSEPKQWQEYDGEQGPGEGKRVVLISGDEEYNSDEALSEIGQILAKHHGFDTTVLYAQDPNEPGIIKPNYRENIPGLKALREADLMVIATRFRELPDEQMEEIERYLQSGKPVVGLRTATHAFRFPKESKWAHWGFRYEGEKSAWKNGFGQLVLGSTWISHHGWHANQSTRGIAAGNNTITKGIDAGDIWGPSDVYGAPSTLPGDSEVQVYGEVVAGMNRIDAPLGAGPYKHVPSYGKNNPDFHKNNPMMPIAWTKTYQLPEGKKGKAFASTMGASNDLNAVGTRRMIVNGIYWAMDLEVPLEGTKVDIVEGYNSSMFGFQSDEYWTEKHRQVSDYDIQ